MDDSEKRICGAKNRQGKPCQKAPMKGKTRCLAHGGKTPKGKHHGPMTHGIYSAGLTDEENALWGDIRLGDVDDEIRLCRVKVRRAMLAQKAVQADPTSTNNLAGMELSEIRAMEDAVQIVTRRPDYTAIIDRFLGRIAQLERTRAELIAAAAERGDGVDEKARNVAAVLRAMIEVETASDGSDSPDDD